MSAPRPEPVVPQFHRANWISLNGTWSFLIDPQDQPGDHTAGDGFDRQITVPFCPESRLSGIGHTDFMESVWYRRTISLPADWVGHRTLLHFGAVDWSAHVYLDGRLIGEHFGGSTRFHFDITDHVTPGRDHTLVVHARDHQRAGTQPAGKQSAQPESFGCYYTRTTGIWQPVWLERTGASYLRDARIVPDLDAGRFLITPEVARSTGALQFRVIASTADGAAGEATGPVLPGAPLSLSLVEPRPWSPEDPHLYDLTLQLLAADGTILDEVASYAGLRSVTVGGDELLLNGKPRFLRLVLDQGFYPDGIWTAPSDDDLRRDIELSMAMGFNGARLHQKVFEPRWHYWADRLGYLTWGEAASWGFDVNGAAGARNFLTEWQDIVRQCRNHPSIIAWTPHTETDHRHGRDDQPMTEAHRRLVRDSATLTRHLDPTRPVNDSSGWVHQDTDLWTSHCYDQDPTALRTRLAPHPDVYRNAPAKEPAYAGQPYYLDEFGGAAWSPDTDFASRGTHDGRGFNAISEPWGYGEAPQSSEEFVARVTAQVDAVLSIPHMRGYCYTQLTDVEQEQNGLLTYQREPKQPLEVYHRIFGRDPD